MDQKRKVGCRGLGMAAILLGMLGCFDAASAMNADPALQTPGGQEQAAAQLPRAQRLVDLFLSQEPDGTRVVLVGDGEVTKFHAFVLRDPHRIVVDLWDMVPGLHSQKIHVASRELAGARLGTYPGKVRVVLDVAKGLKAAPPFSLMREGGRLVLSVGEMARGGQVEQGEPASEKGQTMELASREEPKADAAREEIQWPTQGGTASVESEQAKASPPVSQQPPAEDANPVAAARETFPVRTDETVSTGSGEPQRIAAVTEPPRVPDVAPVEEKDREATLQEEVVAPPMKGKAGKKGVVEEEKISTGRLAASAPQPSPRARALKEAVSLAQISSVKPPTVPAAIEEEEEEEDKDFRIETGTETKTFTGQRIDLEFQDIDLDNIFRLLAEVSNLNILVSDKVKGKLTMRLKNIPWDQALALVISTQKLGMVRQGNVIRVAPLKDLKDEERERGDLRREKVKARREKQKEQRQAEIDLKLLDEERRDFVRETLVLNYTKAADIKKQIDGFLTGPLTKPGIKRKGQTIIDERSNRITVYDYPETISGIKEYIKKVDRPTPQVLVEARIVKAAKNFARDLGIQWGGQVSEFDRRGNWAMAMNMGVGGPVPSTFRSDFATHNPGTPPPPRWLVNLPATLLGAGTPAMGFQIGRLVGDLINLDIRLSAAEREGLTKIVSRPKIMTLDNVEATVKQGHEIPYTQVNPEGATSVVWKQAELKTTVTPLISPDGRIRLKLLITDDAIDPSILSAEGEPSIATRQATTEVLVKDGETVVIGGILEETRSENERGVPYLKDLPGLSWLFKQRDKSNTLQELLIFVTPFIVEDA